MNRGIRYVFANAGTDFAPIIEALVQAKEAGRPVPEFITVPHENVAVSMAHGYYRISGKPAAVMVHVSVGTANTVCGIMNAARDNVPILLAAGQTPNTEKGFAASRDTWIHWGQDSFDQGGMLREFVKWDYELRAGQDVDGIVGRGLDIAMSEPRGPVYLTLPREVLAQQTIDTQVEDTDREPGSIAPVPSEDAIDKTVSTLSAAKFPVILTSYLGRKPENVGLLAELAEEYAIAVVQTSARDINIPFDHPMNLGSRLDSVLDKADVILNIDCEVPWIPRFAEPRDDVVLVHIAQDPFFSRYPYRGFKMHIPVAGSSTAALQMILGKLRSQPGHDKHLVAQRYREICDIHNAHKQQREKFLGDAASMKPIHPHWLAACINKVKSDDTIIVDEMGVAMDYLELSGPCSYITSSPAGGLGMGLGASLGARMAAPDRNVILLIGDGAYMFGNPTPSHFVSVAENLPTLTVVLNNSRWNAVHKSTAGVYPEGRAVKSQQMPLVDLHPSPKFEQIMQACGGYGERVEDPDQLVPALNRGLEAVSGGKPALLNVITQST